ncbi:helix-turn-helix domain-containing protein [Chitinophaga filiformis]|uniref:AraC-type DNA-binding protein n=1 Tax=Chitinophaga filiformis TaxID=104663 RepID=A0A1G7LTW2_CHIFI|nr:AraC family transcriptional regulator [Chitinophaga filiformis]SDF52400.1 AraC-type DNA-binding protein [Chitinophaga filiformis]
MIKRKFQHTFTLLNVDRVNLDTRWNYLNVISPYNRIYYIDQGEGELSGSGEVTKLEPGFLYIIPSFTLCNMKCDNHLGQYFVQFFEDSSDGISLFAHHRTILRVEATALDLQLFNRLLEINPGRGINRSDNPKVYEKDVFYKEYQELNNLQSVAASMETQGILWLLTARFLSPNVLSEQDAQMIPVKLAETLDYIELNMHAELSVNFLASRINQHPDYFSRQFKAYTGTRPVNYINKKRVERAQYLMATTRMNYSEISIQTGFSNLSYFSKAFKKLTGMSPRDYKKQMYLVGFHH